MNKYVHQTNTYMGFIKSLRKIPGIMTFGEKLRMLRDQKQLFQEELADALNKFQKKAKFSRDMIARWENDLDTPRIDRLLAVSNYFGTTVDDLIRPEVKLKKTAKKAAVKSKVRG